MATNLFLPEKKEREIEHELNIAGTYSWTAPDKNRDGSSYEIEVALYGGGGGASSQQSGGAGGYLDGSLSVVPGQVYSIIVGAGGASSGGNSSISVLGSQVVSANGGPPGGTGSQTDAVLTAISGTTTINNSSLFTEDINFSAFVRAFNGRSKYGLYYGAVGVRRDDQSARGLVGGVGGNYVQSATQGVNGRVVLRYSLKENISDNPPV